MSNLKFNPKLVICDYFDKIVNLIDIHTEEQLAKFTKTDLIGDPFYIAFKELPKCDYMGSKGIVFRFQEVDEDEPTQFEYGTNYDLTKHPKTEIKRNSVKTQDYLNKTRNELIGKVKKHEEEAMSRVQEIKQDLLKAIQTIEDRDAQIEWFKQRLFANKQIGVFQIDNFYCWKNDSDFIVIPNGSPFRLYLVVLDFFVDRDAQSFLTNTSFCVDGLLYFGQAKTLRIQAETKQLATKTVDKVD